MKHIELNNGVSIPMVGLGHSWASPNDEAQKEAKNWIVKPSSYRHIDTARTYGTSLCNGGGRSQVQNERSAMLSEKLEFLGRMSSSLANSRATIVEE
ncbi:hypothetical protein C8J56DRAFT_1053467 [Mycena floridula]|nr:hypothetical protein C8J56DRAFT_1053467 [Mycena floridula]